MNFVYSIIVNYHFPLDRLDVYILYLKLAEGPRGGGQMPGCPPPLAAPLLGSESSRRVPSLYRFSAEWAILFASFAYSTEDNTVNICFCLATIQYFKKYYNLPSWACDVQYRSSKWGTCSPRFFYFSKKSIVLKKCVAIFRNLYSYAPVFLIAFQFF